MVDAVSNDVGVDLGEMTEGRTGLEQRECMVFEGSGGVCEGGKMVVVDVDDG